MRDIQIRRTYDGLWLIRTPFAVNYRVTWDEAIALADRIVQAARRKTR